MSMERRGLSGGLIGVNSFLKPKDRLAASKPFEVRLANASIRVAGLKEGLQSLYADPEDVLNKYKEFDIVKAMQDRGDNENLLWVRARAIDADTVNANGDYFSKKELLQPIEVKGEKIPAYKSFEGVPIYTNHENSDIEKAKGVVVYAEWDEKENCVFCTFIVNGEAYPHIVNGIKHGIMHDVSMGCQVEKGECSECGNVATTERDYCDCLKKYKGKTYPGTKRKVYEKNAGLKFIELSVVGDGAFDTCEIEEIYHVEDILRKAQETQKRAGNIYNGIVVAESRTPDNAAEKRAFENCLRQISETTQTAVRLSQVAGTLVGGQMMAAEGSNGNTTVGKILQMLGINENGSINILDMLNLALNFLEVAVMNLFARKDNVDLAHVGKITKSMADLQATMQDMIDDGVDSGGGKGNAPINQGNLGAQGATPPAAGAATPPQAPTTATTQNQSFDYTNAGSVGRALMPVQQMSFGGGAIASNSADRMVVWAGSNKKQSNRQVTASRKTSDTSNPKLTKISENLVGMFEDLENAGWVEHRNLNLNTTNTPMDNMVIGGNMENYTTEEQFMANQLRERQASKYRVRHDFEDDQGTKVVLCSDGSIEAYVENKRVAWEPMLTDEQIRAVAQKKIPEVGGALLRDLQEEVRTAKREGRQVTSAWDLNQNHDTVMEEQIDKKRKGTYDKVQEKLLEGNEALEYKRQGYDNRVREETIDEKRTGPDANKAKENMLADDAGLYKRRGTDDDVKEHLIADARHGSPDVVIEEQLEKVRKNYTPADAQSVMASALNALGTAVVTAKVTPDEILETAQKLASRKDFSELIHLAGLGNTHRRSVVARNNFHEVKAYALSAEDAIFDALGAEINDNIDASNLAEAVAYASNNQSKVSKAVTASAKTKISQVNNYVRESKAKTTRHEEFESALEFEADKTAGNSLDRKHIKASILAFVLAAEDAKATPEEVLEVVASTNRDDLLKQVSMSRSASATDTRMKQRNRTQYWSELEQQSVPAIGNVREATVGALADYAKAYEFSTSSIVDAALRTAKNTKTTSEIVTSAIKESRMSRNAATLRDEKVLTKTITCNADDLGGLDVKDPNFESNFRQKAIAMMQDNGYQVDPATFSFTNLNIDENGEITAEVSSRVSKNMNVQSNGGGMVNGVTPNNVGAIAGNDSVNVDANAGSGNIMPPAPGVQPGTPTTVQIDATGGNDGDTGTDDEPIVSASVKAQRKARRAKYLTRYAQMAGGAGMDLTGGGAGAGADMTGMGAAAPTGVGVSSLTVPTAAGDAPADGTPDTDSMSEPGDKKPWGSVCPQCGSTDVDVANGEGTCNSCNATLKYSFNVEVVPQSDSKSKDGDNGEDPGADATGGGATPPPADAGMGAATGAEGAGAATPGAAGGAAGTGNMMMQASWICDPDAFLIRTAQVHDEDEYSILPPGVICPGCGSRETVATKDKSTRICYQCPTVILSSIEPHKKDNTKVVAKVRWLIS